MRKISYFLEQIKMPEYGAITVEDLKRKIEAGEKFRLIDVREQMEYRIARIEGAELKPLGQISTWMYQLTDKDEEIVIHCHHGMRSDRACQMLAAHGFTNVKNLLGGIDDWSIRVDPSVQRY